MTSTILHAALGYANRGWPVFPAWPDAKTPAVAHWREDASTNPERIRAWWADGPAFNVAIATGHPGPDVLDVDVKDDGKAWDAFGRLKRAGLLAGAVALVQTCSGGRHYYFAGTEQGNAAGIGGVPLDYRGRGGYVIAPPSVVDGGSYELIESRPATGRTFNLKAARNLLAPPRPARPRVVPAAPDTGDLGALTRYVAGLTGPNGRRNDKLHWAACRTAELVAAGKVDVRTAEAELLQAAETNGYVADHSEHEALATIRSGLGVAR